MATQKLKIKYRLKNKTWTTPQIQTYENCHELKLIRPHTDMTQKSRIHTFKLISLTPSVEQIVNLQGFKFMNPEI